MSKVYETLKKKDDPTVEVYPNIESDNIPTGAITTSKISTGAITTSKIADGNVTTSKIASNSITTPKIDNNSITTAKIVSNAITTDKINDEAVTEGKLATSIQNKINKKYYRYGLLINDSSNDWVITISFISSSDYTLNTIYSFNNLTILLWAEGTLYTLTKDIIGSFYDNNNNYGGDKVITIQSSIGLSITLRGVTGLTMLDNTTTGRITSKNEI